MQKKLISILIFNDDKAPITENSASLEQLKPYADKIEIICHSLSKSMPEGITDISVADYGKFVKFASGIEKGRYTVILPPDVTIDGEAFGALLKMLEKPTENIIAFSGSDCPSCVAIDTKLFKNLCQSSSAAQLVNIPLHAHIAAKSYKKVNILPFICSNELLLRIAESNPESFFASVISAVKSFKTRKNANSSQMYKACFDALYTSIETAYTAAVRLMLKDKDFGITAAKFDDELKKVGPRLHDYAERKFRYAPLKKLRALKFKRLPLTTTFKLTFMAKK